MFPYASLSFISVHCNQDVSHLHCTSYFFSTELWCSPASLAPCKGEFCVFAWFACPSDIRWRATGKSSSLYKDLAECSSGITSHSRQTQHGIAALTGGSAHVCAYTHAYTPPLYFYLGQKISCLGWPNWGVGVVPLEMAAGYVILKLLQQLEDLPGL